MEPTERELSMAGRASTELALPLGGSDSDG